MNPPWLLLSIKIKRLSPLLSAFQQVLRDGIGDALHHLNKYNHNDYRRPSHSLVEFLVSVGDGEITKTPPPMYPAMADMSSTPMNRNA